MPTIEKKYDPQLNRELIRKAQNEVFDVAIRAKEDLIRCNEGLIYSIAVRFRDRGTDMDDLMQIGTIGLMKAIDSFDLERGTLFSTYAVPMIFGEIKKHFRDEGPIKIGRYYKKMGVSLMTARQEIQMREGREAGIEELAALCGITPEDAAVVLEANAPMASLQDMVYGDDGVEISSTLADEDTIDDYEKIINHIALEKAVSKMSKEWQAIIALRYYKNMTQQQTANCLGFSQVKVSREEKKIIEYLREEIVK